MKRLVKCEGWYVYLIKKHNKMVERLKSRRNTKTVPGAEYGSTLAPYATPIHQVHELVKRKCQRRIIFSLVHVQKARR